MRFGVAYATHPENVESAVEAERLGYDSVHLYDTPLVFSEVFVVAGAIASRTRHVRLGISVAVPYLRLAHVLAAGVGTLNGFAPGRITLALGTGFTAALTTGSRPDTWATVREYLRICRGVLDGEDTVATVKGERRLIRHLHADLGFINTEDRVPFYVSAAGPKGLRVAAEDADGLYLMSAGQRPDAGALERTIESVNGMAAAAGRAAPDIVLFSTVAVKDPEEPADSPRLMRFVGPAVSQHFHGDLGFGPEDPRTPPLLRAAARRYHEEIAPSLRTDAPWLENHRGHAILVRDEESHLLSAELNEVVCQLGTGEELIAEIRRLEEAGVRELVWQMMPGCEDELGRFADAVMNPYRQRYGTADAVL